MNAEQILPDLTDGSFAKQMTGTECTETASTV